MSDVVGRYLAVFRQRWIGIVAIVGLFVVAAAAISFLPSNRYTASTSFFVSPQVGDTASAAYQGSLLSAQRVSSYVDLLASERVATDVNRTISTGLTDEEVRSSITATSRSGSVLLDVQVRDTDAVRAADIANAVGVVFPALVEELERPATPGGVPPVAIRVVERATPALNPDSNQAPRNLGLGLVLGLVVGGLYAVTRDSLDRSVRTASRLKELTGLPNLGLIALDSAASGQLALQASPSSPLAEAYRQVRTSLQFLQVDRTRSVLAFTSSVASEGKTTTVCNLAYALVAAGYRVLVVEADLRRPRLADFLGLEGQVGLTTVLSRRAELDDVRQSLSGRGLSVITSGPVPPNPSELLGSERMAQVLLEAREKFDYVIVDTPPLLPVTDTLVLGPHTDGLVFLCRFGSTKIAQVSEVMERVKASAVELLGTVLTMVPQKELRSYGGYGTYGDQAGQSAASSMQLSGPPAPVSNSEGKPDSRQTSGEDTTHAREVHMAGDEAITRPHSGYVTRVDRPSPQRRHGQGPPH